MKSLRLAAFIALCVGSFVGTIQPDQKTPQKVELSSQDRAFIKAMFDQVRTLSKQVDSIIEHLALLIKNNVIQGLKNKDHIQRILAEDRQLLKGIMQTLPTITDPIMQLQLVGAIIDVCNAFIEHLEAGLKTNLKTLKPFNPAELQKRSKSSNLSPDKFPQALMDMEKRLNRLKIKSQNAGLTWYNHVARGMDKYLVTPWNQYHCGPIITHVGGAALLATYFILKTGKKSKSPIIKKINDFLSLGQRDGETVFEWFNGIGEFRPFASPYTPEPEGIKTRLLPWIDKNLSDLLSNNAPLAMLFGTFLWQQYTGTWKGYLSPMIHQKMQIWWNKARGGYHLQAETQGLLSIAPKVSFADMTGLDEIKAEFETILNYLADPEALTLAGLQPETGWLLTGPTRTGKSFSFECLCGEIEKMQTARGLTEFKFIKVGIEDIKEHTLEKILFYAKANAPIVIFIDEIDLLGLQRVGDNKVLHDFLTSLQTTKNEDPSKVVIVMAATNKPENLDSALRQYGRFGKEIRFEYPSFKYRKQFIIKELAGMALNLKDFDVDLLAAKLDGKSYEDIKAVIRSAVTRAWTLGVPLSQKLLVDSVNKEMYKIITVDRKELSEDESRILAAHFAGEALAMTLLDTHAQLDAVTIKARMTELRETSAWYTIHQDEKQEQKKIVHGGIFTRNSHDTVHVKNYAHIINEIKVLLAGFAAEEIILGGCSMQCHKEEYTKAHDMLDLLVCKGMNPTQLSKKTLEKLRSQAYELLMQYEQDVKQLLEEHHDALEAITQALMKKGILQDTDVSAIVDKVENKEVAAEVDTDSKAEEVETVENTVEEVEIAEPIAA